MAIAAIDVFYKGSIARTACILFQKWSDETPYKTEIAESTSTDTYIPGEFFKKELPCVLNMLEKLKNEPIELIIVDGYVTLNDKKDHGLGGHLYVSLGEKIPVIGVAKSKYFGNNQHVVNILRGKSNNPLYITAIGIDLIYAASCIKSMFGDFRIPDLLKKVDRLTKDT